MKDEELLMLVKLDLEIPEKNTTRDVYLRHLIRAAKEAIEDEGVTLDLQSGVRDAQLVTMYTAYLYRKRAGENTGMPRMLRYALNNRILSEKMRSGHDGRGAGDDMHIEEYGGSRTSPSRKSCAGAGSLF